VQISNTGNAVLNVSSISLTGAGFSLSSITAPLQLAPGAKKSFTVSFAPAAAASSAKATVSIASNDKVSPTNIAVQGTALKAAPSWEISTGALTFSGVTVQSSQSKSVVLSNNGNVAVTISSVAVTGNGFSLSGINTGTVLSPSQAIGFQVTFHPTTSGSTTGSLKLTGSSVAQLSVSLAGTANTVSTSGAGSGANAQSHSVTLTWNDSGSGIAGYRVYRGTTSGGPYVGISSSLIPITSYVDSSVSSGSKYYYVATAVDASGHESAFSNEALATIPNP
jgi:hypothetical protein